MPSLRGSRADQRRGAGRAAHRVNSRILVDGGNSYYVDDLRRAKDLAPKGIHYVDVGTSGGVFGLERGYCLMIGGEGKPVKDLEPVLAALAPGIASAPRAAGREGRGGTAEQGYRAHGRYAEGLNVLRGASVGKQGRDVDAETTPLRDPEHYQYEFDLGDNACAAHSSLRGFTCRARP